MKYVYIALLIVSIVLIAQNSDAQTTKCLRCLHSIGETCDIRFAAQGLNGYNSCTCSSGCKCSGTCKPTGSQTMLEIDEKFNWNNLEVPESGLFVKFNENDLIFIDSYFSSKGFLSGSVYKEISIGDKIAIYRIGDQEYILYPLTEDGKVNVYSICDEEILATISIYKS